MFRIMAPFAFAATLCAAPLWAQEADAGKVDQLFDALGMPQMIEVMREEGLAYGETLAADMLPGGPSAEWSMAVSTIYDIEMMTEEVRGVLGEALEGDDDPDDDQRRRYHALTVRGRALLRWEADRLQSLVDAVRAAQG